MSDNESPTQPLYRQVAEQIAEEIEADIRPANSRISSERELAEEFGISRMTARAAVNTLVHQGLVIRRNRAVYVAQPKFRFSLSSPHGLHKQLLKAGVEPGAKIIIAEKVPASALTPEIVQTLALDKQDEAYRIVRLRTANNEPIAVENSYFPANLFPDLLDFNLTDSIYGLLKKYFSVESAGSVQEIEISFLDEQWADIMGIAADLPTLEVKRCAVTADNKPFEFAHDIYRGDRLIFTAQTIEPDRAAASSGQVWQRALNNLQHFHNH
jgi:GntR family transcriptional regulator